MTISKRLRFEIFRRDGYRCRYCGATPDQVELRVDHVIPVALGGEAIPENLVAACHPCNAGKTSSSPEERHVAQVADDAIRWARAMEVATADRRQQISDVESCVDAFIDRWKYYELPTNIRAVPESFRASIRTFALQGLSLDEIVHFVDVTADHPNAWDRAFKYFCGCCWNELRDRQRLASAAIQAEEPTEELALLDDHAHAVGSTCPAPCLLRAVG